MFRILRMITRSLLRDTAVYPYLFLAQPETNVHTPQLKVTIAEAAADRARCEGISWVHDFLLFHPCTSAARHRNSLMGTSCGLKTGLKASPQSPRTASRAAGVNQHRSRRHPRYEFVCVDYVLYQLLCWRQLRARQILQINYGNAKIIRMGS